MTRILPILTAMLGIVVAVVAAAGDTTAAGAAESEPRTVLAANAVDGTTSGVAGEPRRILAVGDVHGNTSGVAGEPRRILAVGDVHGNAQGLTEILIEAEVMNHDGAWIGGDTVLVQTGDLLDRGDDVRAAMDLLMSLQAQAPQTGGRVVVLLGNHEAMNLLGIVRDVTPGVYQDLVDRKSKRRLAAAFRDFKKFWRRHAQSEGQSAPNFDSAEQQWYANRPLGFIEYVSALADDGRYGMWLRTFPVAYKVGDTLFLHGGPGPAFAGMTIDELNNRARLEIAAFDRLRKFSVDRGLALPLASIYEIEQAARALVEVPGLELPPDLAQAVDLVLEWQQWMLINSDGPLWYRGPATWTPEHLAEVEKQAARFGCRRIVVGHTPQRTGDIKRRFDGLIYLIDTGMQSSVYTGGQPSALEIEGDRVTAIYLDEREQLEPAADLPLAAGQ